MTGGHYKVHDVYSISMRFMNRQLSLSISKPEQGMLAGMLIGLGFGIWGVSYFEVMVLLDQICIISSSLMTFQLLGGTIAAALGKPPQTRIKYRPEKQ